MFEWQSGDVHANGVRIHYARSGGNKTPLVLAHGFSDDGLCWLPAAESLAQDYDVILPDARGHGHSDLPAGAASGPMEQSAELAGLISALGLPRPLMLGHSMGAMTVLTLAARWPEMPRAMVLEDPPPWWMGDSGPQPYDPAWVRGVSAWLSELRKLPREKIIAAQRAAAPSWAEAELGPWADSKLRFNPAFFDHRQDAIRPDLTALLPQITCPVLLITAARRMGAIISDRDAAALKTLLPHLRRTHIAGAGHSIHREQPKRFWRAVSRFFASVLIDQPGTVRPKLST